MSEALDFRELAEVFERMNDEPPKLPGYMMTTLGTLRYIARRYPESGRWPEEVLALIRSAEPDSRVVEVSCGE